MWHSPIFIGITGNARHGKDSAGSTFEDLGYERVAMADPLKDLALSWAKALYPDLADYVERNGWEAAKVDFPSSRQLLIEIGMGGRAIFGDDFWVREAVKRAKGPAVFTDVRFLNEQCAIENRAYELDTQSQHRVLWLRVNRPGQEAPGPFEREVPLIPVHSVVENNGTLFDLADRCTAAYRAFVKCGWSPLEQCA